MRSVAIILGLAFAVVAIVYWVLPAGLLPAFFPGYEAGSSHIHVKHGIAAALLAVQHGATIVRVHDVAATRDALAVLAAMDGQGGRGRP